MMMGLTCPPVIGPADKMRRVRVAAFTTEPRRLGKRAPDVKSLCTGSQTNAKVLEIMIASSRDCGDKRVCC